MKKILLSLLVSLCISACGFHLKGAVDIPTWLENVYIVNDLANKELAEMLSAQLNGYKIKVAQTPNEANYWIIIDSSTLSQNIISIGSSTNPRQYQLSLVTQFTLQTNNGVPVNTPQKIFSSRQFTSNNDRILGSNEEESLLHQEMQRDTVEQIINRLSKMSRTPKKIN